MEFQKKCIGRMKDISVNDGRTVLFVSHNMNAIQHLCDNAILLKNGMLLENGNVKNVVFKYLNEKESLSNFKKYEKYIKHIKVEQINDTIFLNAEYKLDFSIDVPHLGFVFYNDEGIPIFGSNPTLSNVITDSKEYKEGTISIQINEPKLIDGKYFVSIWFGDSKRNFLVDEDCLSLNVFGMLSNKQQHHNISGNIIPKTEWKFT